MKKSKVLPVFLATVTALAVATAPGCKGPTDPDVGGGGGINQGQTTTINGVTFIDVAKSNHVCQGCQGLAQGGAIANGNEIHDDPTRMENYLKELAKLWEAGGNNKVGHAYTSNFYNVPGVAPCWTLEQVYAAMDVALGMGRSQGRMSIIR